MTNKNPIETNQTQPNPLEAEVARLQDQVKQSNYLLQAVMDQRNTAMNTSADYHAEILRLRSQLEEISKR